MTDTLPQPAPVHVATPHGDVVLRFLPPGRVLVQCGKSSGWFRLDGARYYAAALYTPGHSGWTADREDAHVSAVIDRDGTGGFADKPAPEPVRQAALAALDDVFHAWIAQRPDVDAYAALVAAVHADSEAEAVVTALELRLAEARAALRTRRIVRDNALDLMRHLATRGPA